MTIPDPTLERQIHLEVEENPGDSPLEVEAGRVTVPPRDLVGIALSGGGIRSATFNLGLLQGLARFRLLDRLDYLSTVSGGGYIGSCWSAWRARGKTDRDPTPFTEPSTGVDPEAPRPVPHLREFSNFLAPRLGLLSWDTGRMVVTVASSMIPSLLAALSVLTLAVLLWCLAAWGLLAPTPPVSTAIFLGITASLLGWMEALWRKQEEEIDLWGYGEAWTVALVTSGLLWFFLSMGFWGAEGGWYGEGQRIPVIGDQAPPSEWLYLLLPVGAWAGASLFLSVWRWFRSRWSRSHLRRVRRNAFDRVHARILLLSVVWTGVTALWWAGALLWGVAEVGLHGEVATGLVGSTGLVVWFFSRVQKRLSGEFTTSVGTTLLSRLRPILPQALAYLALALLVVMITAGIVGLDRSDLTLHPPLALAAAAALALALVALLFDPNEVGLHTFYRARIARAYLGASNPDKEARWKTEEREDDDVELREVPATRPCHLICCAANDLSTRELGDLHRGARSAVLSPVGFSVGERYRPWEPDVSGPTLSAAVTASAAAFNPLMGDRSRALGPAVTFLMAAFNLRLGMWLSGPSTHGDPNRGRSRAERVLVGLPFFREMFGLANARGRHVHLSDGGHFENMAVYELIRRHCRFIVASDCGMDPSVSFNDFGNLVRRVRMDFGVDIQIDLAPLRPDAQGISRQPMVAGDIHYPEGDTGILLLIKPTITGGEPADVAQYRTRNPVFPHESTRDQFYDEAQWESYRRLGEHVAHAAFRRVAQDLDGAVGDSVHELFLRARREWQPVPEGFGSRLSHFADRIGELDALLRDPECANLRREVFRELADLTRDPDAAEMEGEDNANAPDGRSPSPRANGLDPADLGPSLHLIRRCLLLMQEIYTRENLEERAYHPLHLGLMNYFARWTSAPLFRMWWPLLKTMYPQPFTRFVERQFGVRPTAGPGSSVDGVAGSLSRELEGFAMSAWRQQRPGPLPPDRYFLPYLMRLRYLDRVYSVQAAHIVVARGEGYLAWNMDDFYVPPGLWGVGIGQNFLRSLRRDPPVEGETEAGLFVRMKVAADAGSADKKRIANEVQLYRSSGFSEIATRDVPLAVRRALADEVAPETPGDPVVPQGPEPSRDGEGVDEPHGEAAGSDGTRWMTARSTPTMFPAEPVSRPR